MTLTPEQEEEVRKAWNKCCLSCMKATKRIWGWWISMPASSRSEHARAAMFGRKMFITAKGWDKEGM